MADLDDVEQAIDRVEGSIERVEESIKKIVSWPSNLAWVFCFLVAFDWFVSAVHSKRRYEIQYGVASSDVHIDSKPHDCEFLSAPIGAKYCSYEVIVLEEAVRPSQQPGTFVVSQDGGKTWNPTTLTTPYHGVWVRWNKVSE